MIQKISNHSNLYNYSQNSYPEDYNSSLEKQEFIELIKKII